MTPEQMAAWLGDFVKKNNARLTDIQRQNFQMCQHTLLTQQTAIDQLTKATP